ncbi:MAG: flagellar basal body rod protein FlgC [Clostridiales bacterium]|nr:flagellar basal body rod protein FlgC [Clostridiales bacterium]
MAFLNSLNIGGSALSAQRLRMDIIAQNIANSQTTRTESGEPYRRQQVVFAERSAFSNVLSEKIASRKKMALSGVVVERVVEDDTPLRPVYDPTHVDADENGYVYMPNVDTAKEQIDLMAATRSYDANITVVNAVKSMAVKALQIGK